VENQIFIALITYCLLMLLKTETGFKGTLQTIQRLLRTCLCETFDTFCRSFSERATEAQKAEGKSTTR
jgi:hypothetical protein